MKERCRNYVGVACVEEAVLQLTEKSMKKDTCQ